MISSSVKTYVREQFGPIEDVPKHVGPNLVFADDDQQRSRPGRLAKAGGYLTPPVDFATDGQTDRQTDRQTDELKVFWAFHSHFKK